MRTNNQLKKQLWGILSRRSGKKYADTFEEMSDEILQFVDISRESAYWISNVVTIRGCEFIDGKARASDEEMSREIIAKVYKEKEYEANCLDRNGDIIRPRDHKCQCGARAVVLRESFASGNEEPDWSRYQCAACCRIEVRLCSKKDACDLKDKCIHSGACVREGYRCLQW